jgi:thiamine-monophosphate kinase
MTRVGQIGERGLLQLIAGYCSDRFGDDAAVMGATQAGWEMVVTTDMLVQGVHFSPQTTSAYDVGWRAGTANLSDLASMGADPWGLTIALGVPSDTPVAWVEGVYQGLAECAQQFHTSIVGGDTVRSPVPVLSITAIGQVPSHQIMRRNQAQIGDVILSTGQHGLSRAGLALLLHPHLQELISPENAKFLIQCHQRPQPRLDVVTQIRRLANDAPLAIAGMDSSDGLADAIQQICAASGVGASIDLDTISIHPDLHILAGSEALNWVLFGGEDFELVLCLAPDLGERLLCFLPSGEIIGRIVPPEQGNLHQLQQNQGFQHFIA